MTNEILTQMADLSQFGDEDDDGALISSQHQPSPMISSPQPWGRLLPCCPTGSIHALYPRAPAHLESSRIDTAWHYELRPQDLFNEHTIGRSAKCDIPVVKPPSSITEKGKTLDQKKMQSRQEWCHGMISNRHCRIFCTLHATQAMEEHSGMAMKFASMQVWIEDCSGNGTVINGSTLLQKGDRRLLHSGDEICLVQRQTLQKKISSRTELQSLLHQYSFVFVNCVTSATTNSPTTAPSLPFTVESSTRLADLDETFVPPSTGNRSKRKAAVDVRATKSTRPRFSMDPDLDAQARKKHEKDSISSAIDAPNRRISPRRQPPRRIQQDYDIRDILGKGTMGEVHRAIHRQSGRTVAVKTIPYHARGNLLSSQTMEMEATILRNLRHPYIVKLLDVYTCSNALYLVMELVPGGDLFDRIDQKGHYSEIDARRVMRRLLAAVHYLHETCGIVHRDLKPENILLSSRASDIDVQLTDFGLAKPDGDCKTFCGTPQYFAPEVLRRRHTVKGAGRYGKQADMWSLGVILYVLLTGYMPFDKQHDDAMPMSSQSNGEAPIVEFPSHISLAAQDIMRQLLQYDPRKRASVLSACSHSWILQEDGDTHVHPLDDPKLLDISSGARDHPVIMPSASLRRVVTTAESSTVATDSSIDHHVPSLGSAFALPNSLASSAGSAHKVIASAQNFSFDKDFHSCEKSSPKETIQTSWNSSLLEVRSEDVCSLDAKGENVAFTSDRSPFKSISPASALTDVRLVAQPGWTDRLTEDAKDDDVLSKFTENTESVDSFNSTVNGDVVHLGIKENIPIHTEITSHTKVLKITKRPSIQPRSRGKSKNLSKGSRRRGGSATKHASTTEKSVLRPTVNDPLPTIQVKKISSGGKQTTLKTWFKKQR